MDLCRALLGYLWLIPDGGCSLASTDMEAFDFVLRTGPILREGWLGLDCRTIHTAALQAPLQAGLQKDSQEHHSCLSAPVAVDLLIVVAGAEQMVLAAAVGLESRRKNGPGLSPMEDKPGFQSLG